MHTGQYEQISHDVESFWFHGFTYNETPGSRSQITTTIKNGDAFCIDPEAWADRASLPSGMTVRGKGEPNGNFFNVTRPATGILGWFAGVVEGLPPEGLLGTTTKNNGGYVGGVMLKLRRRGPALAKVLGDFSSTKYDTLLGPVDGSFALGVIALGTNGANLPLIVAKPGVKDNVATAAVHPVYLRALGA